MDNHSPNIVRKKDLIGSVFSIIKTGTTNSVPKLKKKPTKITVQCNGKTRSYSKNLEKNSENFENIFKNNIESNQIVKYTLVILFLLLLFMLFKKKY